jgi:hypothetical protein
MSAPPHPANALRRDNRMNSPKGRASFANHLANHISCCSDIAKGNKVESSPFPQATADEAAFFNGRQSPIDGASRAVRTDACAGQT